MLWNFWNRVYNLTILSRTDKHYIWFIRVYGHMKTWTWFIMVGTNGNTFKSDLYVRSDFFLVWTAVCWLLFFHLYLRDIHMQHLPGPLWRFWCYMCDRYLHLLWGTSICRPFGAWDRFHLLPLIPKTRARTSSDTVGLSTTRWL